VKRPKRRGDGGDLRGDRRGIAGDDAAELYARLDGERRVVLVSRVTGAPWIVEAGLDGAVETAFPSADPVGYVTDPRIVRLGMAGALPRRGP
jgi:hypothetical protein